MGAKDFKAHFKCKIGYNGAEVCVAASLSETVYRSLYVAGSCPNGGESISGGTVAVIVSMDSDRQRGKLIADGFCDFVHFVG